VTTYNLKKTFYFDSYRLAVVADRSILMLDSFEFKLLKSSKQELQMEERLRIQAQGPTAQG
jgi:hypothetical protein